MKCKWISIRQAPEMNHNPCHITTFEANWKMVESKVKHSNIHYKRIMAVGRNNEYTNITSGKHSTHMEGRCLFKAANGIEDFIL